MLVRKERVSAGRQRTMLAVGVACRRVLPRRGVDRTESRYRVGGACLH